MLTFVAHSLSVTYVPNLTINGATLHYETHGTGTETIAFAHGLLWSGRMFADQVAALQDRYRCITFDFRGQGQSQVTPGGYDMDTLTEDMAQLIVQLSAAPCHFVGLSMGGFVGMRLAARHPHLLRSLTLLETSAEAEPAENASRYRLLNFVVRWLGAKAVVSKVMPIMFGQKFLTDPARVDQRRHWERELASNHRVGITRATRGVITRAGVLPELARIQLPTLVVVGDQDVATVPAKARTIQAHIAGAQLTVVPGAGHTATVEEPAAVNAALKAFLAGLPVS